MLTAFPFAIIIGANVYRGIVSTGLNLMHVYFFIDSFSSAIMRYLVSSPFTIGENNAEMK